MFFKRNFFPIFLWQTCLCRRLTSTKAKGGRFPTSVWWWRHAGVYPLDCFVCLLIINVFYYPYYHLLPALWHSPWIWPWLNPPRFVQMELSQRDQALARMTANRCAGHPITHKRQEIIPQPSWVHGCERKKIAQLNMWQKISQGLHSIYLYHFSFPRYGRLKSKFLCERYSHCIYSSCSIELTKTGNTWSLTAVKRAFKM